MPCKHAEPVVLLLLAWVLQAAEVGALLLRVAVT